MTDIVYRQNSHGLEKYYDIGSAHSFNIDDVAGMGFEDLEPCATSPHWEDRVRAAVLQRHLKVTMPDQFPCIFELADSPQNIRDGERVWHAKDDPWVVSADVDMLVTLLPDYQALWDHYTARWGPQARRVFDVGFLDGIPVHTVFRPGTTPAEVLAHTCRRHNMVMPDRLRTR